VEVHGTVSAWYWSDAVSIAVPGGIACYTAGSDYAHGGLTVQECVVPEMTVSRAAPSAPVVVIESVRWKGLRCQVQMGAGAANLSCDLRANTNDPQSSLLAAPKTIAANGTVSLPVEDDSKQGNAAVIVVLAGNGSVVAKRVTTVGGGE
jgi:hypothetical protein